MTHTNHTDPAPAPAIDATSPYMWGRLSAALTTAVDHTDPATRERASRKVSQWSDALYALSNGQITIGARAAVKNLPLWATPEVIQGGFVTGRARANLTGIDEDEITLANQHNIPATRADLFAWALTDTGLAWLDNLLDTGDWRSVIPEHTALLTVAWLLRNGHTDEATAILSDISPYADRLRFLPIPTDAPDVIGVSVTTVGQVADTLAAKKPSQQVILNRDSLTRWLPMRARAAALWQAAGPLDLTTTSREVLPDGWAAAATALVAEYDEAVKTAPRIGDRWYSTPVKHAQPGSTLNVIVEGLRTRATGDRRVANHGTLRRAHNAVSTLAGHPTTAEEYAARSGGVPVDMSEAAHQFAGQLRTSGVDLNVGHPDPRNIVPNTPDVFAAKLDAATLAPLPVLLERGIVSSAEQMANLAADVAAEVFAAQHDDPAGAALAGRGYRAFRNRRSLLLFTYEHQVRAEEIPWLSVVLTHADRPTSASTAPHAAYLASLAYQHFPGTILPNRLVSELDALYRNAHVDVPLMSEVAADIFMGGFSGTFARAAKDAAQVLAGPGSLYATYYGLDDVYATDDAHKSKTWLADMSYDRAGQARRTGWGWSSPAANGAVIEQAQVITSHNIATLYRAGAFATWTPDMFARAVEGAVATMHAEAGKWQTAGRAGLRNRKNAAYALRQAIAFATLGNVPFDVPKVQGANSPFYGWLTR